MQRTAIERRMPRIEEIALPTQGLQPGSKGYKMGVVRAIVSPPFAEYKMGWHMSVSCRARYPTWDEIAHLRYQLLPGDITMAMLLPPMAEYVNLHDFCFHLHQIENELSR